MAIPALQAFVAQVGPNTVQDGNSPALRAGRTGELIAQELHGRYYETTYRKGMFSGSIIGQVTTVGLATTYTGLVLANPPGSSVNLIVNKVGVGFLVAFAAGAAVGLMTGYSGVALTGITAVTVRNQMFNSGGPGQGLLASAATLPIAPTVNTIFGAGLTGAITTTPAAFGLFDLEGSLILPPGAYAAIYTSTASGTASMAASMSWEEVLL
jgi:hypothetical protein